MDPDAGASAVRFARSIIEDETGGAPEHIDVPDGFYEPKGAFVTLKTYPDGDLRGCIGIPLPVLPLRDALEEAARSACHDPRFIDLEHHELKGLTVEVTILDVPKALECSRSELPDNIVIGRDGLIISFRGRRGLLLPQVPEEQGWDAVEYLEGLCRKAGLPRDAWKDERCEISAFSGKIFFEIEPYGNITEG